MEFHHDDLSNFAVNGAAPLPAPNDQSAIEHEGARIYYASYGSGPPVILLHGGLGNSENWGYQVPALTQNGYQAVLIDSRGHGRSTRDDRPFHFEVMATDVLAVMDALHIKKAALVGWSDGAVVALMVAQKAAGRVAGVFFFACNVDPRGVLPITQISETMTRCWRRHAQDYARLSATPGGFKSFADAVSFMQEAEPNFSQEDLAKIKVPVNVVQAQHDEFIKAEHAEYLAISLPDAQLTVLPGVSHFAPLQRPRQFIQVLLGFLDGIFR